MSTNSQWLTAQGPTKMVSYGSDPLFRCRSCGCRTAAGPYPVAVVIRGGCYTEAFTTRRRMAPLASAHVDKSVATSNIENPRVGDTGGGRPSTHRDWAHAARHVRILAKAYPPDLARMITIGHLGASAQSITRRHGDVRLRDYKCPDH